MPSTKSPNSIINLCQRENLAKQREMAIANYRERIAQDKRTKMTSDERQILIEWFIETLITLEDETDIKALCEAEIALLEEGYPQNTIASDILGKYRHAISNAIEAGTIPLTPQNSHHYTYQKRNTGEEETAHEHYALTYLKYDPHTYQELRNQTTQVNNQRQDNLQPIHLYTYIDQIETLLHSPDHQKDLDLHLAIAIAGATGRRHTEVLTRGSFTLTDHPYLLYFEGQQKKKEGEPTNFAILTILPAQAVFKALKRFRAIPTIANLQGRLASDPLVKSFNVQVNRKVQALFQETGIVPVIGQKKYVSLHRLRGIYGAIAVHYFCPESQHEHRFLQNYLGHTLSEQIAPNSSATPHYFHYYLVDNNGKHLGQKGIKLSEFPLPEQPDSLSKITDPETSPSPTTTPSDFESTQLLLDPHFIDSSISKTFQNALPQMLSSDRYTVLLAGLMAVTGRSPGELIKSGTFEANDHPFAVIFSSTGIGAKSRLTTLVDASIVLEGIQRLRNHPDVQSLLYQTPAHINEHCQPYILQAFSHHLQFDTIESAFSFYTLSSKNHTPLSPTDSPDPSEDSPQPLNPQPLDVSSLTESQSQQLEVIASRLGLHGNHDDLFDGLVQWVHSQLDSPPPQPTLDPILTQALKDQASTLAWLTQRLDSIESTQPHHDSPQPQQAVNSEEVSQLREENTRLKQQLEALEAQQQQLIQENEHFRQLNERVELARQALFGEQEQPLPSTPQTPSSNTPASTTPTSGSSSSAIARAKTICNAILQWNQDHPDDSWAVNRGLLEKTFKINRKAAGQFLDDYSTLVDTVHQAGQVKNPRSHNRHKDPTSLKAFVQSFFDHSS